MAKCSHLDGQNKNRALLDAALHGHEECIELLLKEGADVNARDGRGNSVLKRASDMGHLTCVKKLVNSGADVNKKSSIYREIALLCSIQESYSDREIGANVNSTNARSLTASGVGALKLLLEAGVDVNICDISGVSCIMKAAANGNAECMKELIKAGADVNGFSINGVSALMFTLIVNNIQCLGILLGTGANVNEQSNFPPTALMYAARKGHAQALECLLESGADVNFVATNGETALKLATKNGHTQCVELLIAAADVNLKLNLKHICRRMIRKHLLKLDRHKNLFVRIPQLGLPSIITEYMLYGVSPM